MISQIVMHSNNFALGRKVQAITQTESFSFSGGHIIKIVTGYEYIQRVWFRQINKNISYPVMFFNKFDSYYYSRPISYRSYYPRIAKPEVLQINDPQSQQVLSFLQQQNIEANNLGGLARGIRFWDYEVGRRHYNHNSFNVADEFFIHQWKETNDLTKEHPTGTHLVFKTWPEFMTKLRQVIEERRKKY